MKKVFMVHGFGSNPDRNWFPWLSKELEKYDINTCMFYMPDSRYPVEKEWVKTIRDSIIIPSEDVFLVGHSLGASSILRYLETLKSDEKIGGAILVSGAIKYVPGPEGRYDLLNKFVDHSFDFEHINKVCKKFIVIHGVDDPIVPFSQAEELSNKLFCKLMPIEKGGHLNDKAGFKELPETLDSLLKMLK